MKIVLTEKLDRIRIDIVRKRKVFTILPCNFSLYKWNRNKKSLQYKWGIIFQYEWMMWAVKLSFKGKVND